MFAAVLHCIPDEDDPAVIAARYLAALAPGSYLVLSYSTDEFAPDRTHQASAEAKARGATWIPRSMDDILRMFNGRELLDPGLMLVSSWRPDGGASRPQRGLGLVLRRHRADLTIALLRGHGRRLAGPLNTLFAGRQRMGSP
jgi:hypothetical protein